MTEPNPAELRTGTETLSQADADAIVRSHLDRLDAFQQAQPTPEYGKVHTDGSRSGGQPPKLTPDAMREALVDLLSWFPDIPSEPKWELKSGKQGADDAIAHVRSLLKGAVK